MKKLSLLLAAVVLVAAVGIGVLSGQRNTLTTAKNDLEKQVAELTEKNEALTKQEEAFKTLEGEKTKADEAIKALEGEKAKADEAIKALEGEKAKADEELKAAQTALETLQGEKDKAAADLTAAQAALKTAQDELAALKADKDKSESGLSEALESLKAKAAELETQLAAKTQEFETALAGKVKELETALTDKEAISKELDKVKNALLAGIPDPQEADEPDKVSEKAAVITILHTNDVHSRVEGNDKDQIGYARLAAIVKGTRANGPTLLLDAGDTLHGMAFANLEKGMSVVKLMNMLGYDAMAPGNHDFNYGFDRLKELEKEMDFSLLSANIMGADGKNAFSPYTILECGGHKIAVIGAENPQMVTAIHPDMIKGLTFESLDVLKDVVKEAAEQSDAVIILAHWGADDAYKPNSGALAAIPGVDLVIDGHSHTFFENIKQVDGHALVVSAGEYMKNIGRVVMRFDPNGKLAECTALPIPFEMAAENIPDEETAAFIGTIQAAQDEILNIVVGKTEVKLDGERETNRTGETNLGNLATDALRWYTNADIAFTNGGGIRKSIEQGSITKRDVVEVFPFGNSVVTIEVSGEQILAAMEHGLSKYPEQNGGFPQISNAKIVFDGQAQPGGRVLLMEVGGKPIEKDKNYILATNDFLAAGGDGYEMFKGETILQYRGTMDEAFGAYVTEKGVVDTKVEGRVTVAPPVEPVAEPAAKEEPAKEEAAKAEPKALEPVKAAKDGFAGPVAVLVGFNDMGEIVSLVIGDESFSETDGLGAEALKPEFAAQFIGKKAPLKITDIDALSGATITSEAVVAAINEAAATLQK